jgi:hypothetical protein
MPGFAQTHVEMALLGSELRTSRQPLLQRRSAQKYFFTTLLLNQHSDKHCGGALFCASQ